MSDSGDEEIPVDKDNPVYILLQPDLDDTLNVDNLQYPPEPADLPHLEFIRDNPGGFLRVAKLHPSPHKVTLVRSLGDDDNPGGELYIRKQCRLMD